MPCFQLLIAMASTLLRTFWPSDCFFRINTLVISVPASQKQQEMYTGYKPSNSLNKSVNSQHTKGSVNVSQLESLQREVDNYTRKLEQEKRKRFGIDETLLMVTEEHHKQAERLKQLKIKSQSSQTFKLNVQIKNLENKLQQAISVYDETVSHNNALKAAIDQLRKEKKNFAQVYEGLCEEERHYVAEIKRKQEENEKKVEQNARVNKEIEQLQHKNEEEKARIVKQFEQLEENYRRLKEDRQKDKSHDIQDKVETIDTQPVLKLRLKKLIAKNKEKVRIMEEYQRKMRLIGQAFNEIKAGSGISDIEEITNTFIKSEEQNYSLYNYVDNLSQNIDSLAEENKILEQKIANLERENEERRKILCGTPEEEQKRKRMQKIIKEKEGVIEQLRSLVQAIQPELERTLLELARSKYNDDPNKLYDYEIGFNINETNIEQYLADLQKYVNILVDLNSHEKKAPTTFELHKESSRNDGKDEQLAKALTSSITLEDKTEGLMTKEKFEELAKEIISNNKKKKGKDEKA